MATIRRLARVISILARDSRIPRPLRAAAALGLLPLPGPLDEAILALAAVPLLVFYRGPMREAWASARFGGPGRSGQAGASSLT
jgi:hypothetical protein